MREIISDTLVLRSFTNEDLHDLHEYLAHESIYLYEYGKPLSIDEAEKLLQSRIQDERFWAIVLKHSNKLIGNIYFEQDTWTEIESYKLGYIVNPDFQNKGYCTEACRMIISHAFKDLKAHRIEARCNIKNTSSNRVLEKVGFRLEGTLKYNVFLHRDKNGNPIWNTSNVYGLLSDEWI